MISFFDAGVTQEKLGCSMYAAPEEMGEKNGHIRLSDCFAGVNQRGGEK